MPLCIISQCRWKYMLFAAFHEFSRRFNDVITSLVCDWSATRVLERVSAGWVASASFSPQCSVAPTVHAFVQHHVEVFWSCWLRQGFFGWWYCRCHFQDSCSPYWAREIVTTGSGYKQTNCRRPAIQRWVPILRFTGASPTCAELIKFDIMLDIFLHIMLACTCNLKII